MGAEVLPARAQLDAQGFVVLDNAVNAQVLAQLEARFELFFARYTHLPARFRKELSAEEGGARELNRVAELIPDLYKNAALRAVAERCRAVLGHGVAFTFANAILKPAYCGAAVRPHQDGAYDGAGPHDAADHGYTVWLPFRDAEAGNGALYYLPESHKRGLVAHDVRADVRSMTPAPEDIRVTTPVAAGGFALHYALVVHGSHPNTSDRSRLALSLRLRRAHV